MTTSLFDAAEYLTTEIGVGAFLEAALESEDTRHVARAFGIAARSKGMEELARRVGGAPQDLFKRLAELPEPSLAHFGSVLDAFGMRGRVDSEAA